MYYTCIQQAQDDKELPQRTQVPKDGFLSDRKVIHKLAERKDSENDSSTHVSPSSEEQADEGPRDLIQGCQEIGFHNLLCSRGEEDGLLQGPPRASASVKRHKS